MKASKYRADIDGLRALAVLAVLFFHAGFTSFSGGFVGVDVFFVISGFLITRLIRDEVEAGTFKFSNFYMRRARRLFPALFFTVSVSLIAGMILFSPPDLERFGGAALHTMLSVSNFYFWLESGYFDVTAHFKPLLHTWSLSVEEQFYLIWPAVLVFLLTRCRLWVLLTVLIGGSLLTLALSEFFLAYGTKLFANLQSINVRQVHIESTLFYLAPFRAFEFAIGALMVWGIEYKLKKPWIHELLVLSGLAMIAWPVMVYTKDTPFPSINALLPCLGTALVIYSGTAKHAGKILNNRLAVGIGLISYSLYLIHWPLLVFYKYARFDAVNTIEILCICFASILIATLMYFYVEQPFRKKAKDKNALPPGKFGLNCVLLALLLVLPATHIWLSKGWEWRISPDMQQLMESAGHKDAKLDNPCQYVADGILPASFEDSFNTCVKTQGKAVLVIGDSHGIDLFHALAINSPYTHIAGLTMGGCRLHTQKGCGAFYDLMQRFIQNNHKNLKAIIYKQKGSYFLSGDFSNLPVNEDYIHTVKTHLNELSGLRVPVLWIGPQPETIQDPRAAITPFTQSAEDIESTVTWNANIVEVDARIQDQIKDVKFTYISVITSLFPEGNARYILDSQFTYSDTDHWSAKGEQVFGKELIENSRKLQRLLR